jgi:predicted Zn-ribbon and HTH transcriptional regulator
MKNIKCKKCGYEWTPIVEVPKSCPKCKTRNYKTHRGGRK